MEIKTETKSIYVVFSSTRCGIGSMIRAFTNNKYNHVSISLTPSLETLYSFARYHKNAPFYGGFVMESCLRYFQGGGIADIKVCEISVTPAVYDMIKLKLEAMDYKRDTYIYNTLSAFFTLFKKRIVIPKSYTCVEFAVDLISEFNIDCNIQEKKFYYIKDIEQILSDKVIYEGPFTLPCSNCDWNADVFLLRKNVFAVLYLSAYLQARLIRRFFINKF